MKIFPFRLPAGFCNKLKGMDEDMRIQYVCICNRGLIRKNNQDNLVWERHFLPKGNDGLPEPVSGEIQLKGGILFGVFDGMGGEPRGDAAAYIAAKTAAQWEIHADEKGLRELCHTMNSEICNFARLNRLSTCGTTAAMLLADSGQMIGCNLGDSRIYLFREGCLTQLSEDHVLPVFTGKKSPLLQFLGIPEYEMVLEPGLFTQEFRPKDLFMICSDGLTDMMTEDAINTVFRDPAPIEEKAQFLLDGVLASGGKDNITFILIKRSD